MRIVASVEKPRRGLRAPVSRTATIEGVALAAVTLVIVAGLALVHLGRGAGSDGGASPVLDVRQIRDAAQLEPLLETLTEGTERRLVADALVKRIVSDPPIDHVGELARVTVPAAAVRADARLIGLRTRLDRRPELATVPVLAPSDLAALKPHLTVRTAAEFRRTLLVALLVFVGAFAAAHGIRRARGSIGDPVVLPAVMLLCGLGLLSLLTLRDPLRDTIPVAASITGILAGAALLVAASEVDIEASPLRRAVLAPLAVAVTLAALLLVFGTGPGTSGARLRLLGFQPADLIRLLVVMALAAHFARRGEFLREYAQSATAAAPWLRRVRVPRWPDVGPALASVGIVVAFFFLQRDLGPALVLAGVFLGMYGVARRRGVLVVGGLLAVLFAFGVAYWTGVPGTVRQRVAIWIDPWRNGVSGGDQVAHGLWGLATGAAWGSGLGRGSGAMVPAGDTDFVLAIVGEELGFAGMAVLVLLYALVCWRCLRIALRAPGEYSALLAIGIALTFVVQATVIACGVLGLLPLSGVVTPFLSYGRSAMVANFAALGLVLAIGRRQGAVRLPLVAPVRTLSAVLMLAAVAVLGRAAWIQLADADAIATTASLTEQADGGFRFAYNPRLLAAARLIPRGTIYDRNGLVLAASLPADVAGIGRAYAKAGLDARPCLTGMRCYPLGAKAVHVLGNWNTQANWGASNSSYVERDRDAQLKGFDDRPRAVEVADPRTRTAARVVLRDYHALLPLARDRFERRPTAVRALLTRDRSVHLALDARLQVRTAAALERRIHADHLDRGAAVVLDVASGDVLAAASYPLPDEEATAAALVRGDDSPWLDRVRYGLYPPGSTFKMVVAAAALRAGAVNRTFACVRLPDGRVGNTVRGWTRPVRDDPMDRVPHGTIGLHDALVVSCNAYFAQLAVGLGPAAILDAASLFSIDVARPETPARLARTLAHAGYGQGEVVVSPLKMARVAAAVAHDGSILPVRWTTSDPRPAGEQRRLLDTGQSRVLGSYLRDVVSSGTGRTLRGNATPIAGKTGTAEVDGEAAHSWFAGFAPYGGTRRIAFAVLLENAGYGARAAAPVAGEVVDAARDLGLLR